MQGRIKSPVEELLKGTKYPDSVFIMRMTDFEWADFDWFKENETHNKRAKVLSRKFKEWREAVRERWINRLLNGKNVCMGVKMGTIVPYKTDMPATFQKGSVNWKETKELGRLRFFPPMSYKYRAKVRVFGPRMDHTVFAFPKVNKRQCPDFFRKLYDNLHNIQEGTRSKSCYFDDRKDNFISNKLFRRTTEDIAILKDTAHVLGVHKDFILEWADAYNRYFDFRLRSANKKGGTYMSFLTYSSIGTIRRYKTIDKEWTGAKQTVKKDGYLWNIVRFGKNAMRSLYSPSRYMHQALRLIKREDPKTYLDTDKCIDYLWDKLNKEGETGITKDYLTYVANILHRPYIKNFATSFVYKRLGKVNGEGESS